MRKQDLNLSIRSKEIGARSSVEWTNLSRLYNSYFSKNHGIAEPGVEGLLTKVPLVRRLSSLPNVENGSRYFGAIILITSRRKVLRIPDFIKQKGSIKGRTSG